MGMPQDSGGLIMECPSPDESNVEWCNCIKKHTAGSLGVIPLNNSPLHSMFNAIFLSFHTGFT